jgi:hypothetical protein
VASREQRYNSRADRAETCRSACGIQTATYWRQYTHRPSRFPQHRAPSKRGRGGRAKGPSTDAKYRVFCFGAFAPRRRRDWSPASLLMATSAPSTSAETPLPPSCVPHPIHEDSFSAQHHLLMQRLAAGQPPVTPLPFSSFSSGSRGEASSVSSAALAGLRRCPSGSGGLLDSLDGLRAQVRLLRSQVEVGRLRSRPKIRALAFPAENRLGAIAPVSFLLLSPPYCPRDATHARCRSLPITAPPPRFSCSPSPSS